MADTDKADLTSLTVELLSSYVANNSVRSEDLGGLIQSTHAALAALDVPSPVAAEPAAPEYVPAVSVRKSLGSREHILSLIDGKPYKTLKRHLSGHGLTPEDYRQRYSLPASYPMVAPAYSERRRDVANALGLGRKPKVASEAAEPVAKPAARKPRAAKVAAAEPVAAVAAPKRGRKPKVAEVATVGAEAVTADA